MALPVTAFACFRGETTLQAGSTHVAPTGSLHLLFRCSYDCEPTQPDVAVRSVDGQEVAGNVVSHTEVGTYQWLVWRPTQPLAASATYTVEAATSRGTNGGTWMFDTKPVSLEPAPMPLTFRATPTVAGVGGTVRCQGAPNRMWCHGEPTFEVHRQDAVLLELTTADSAPTAGFDFLYRVTFRAGSETMVMPDQPSPAAQLTSLTAAKDYCYALDAMHLATGELIHISDSCQSLALAPFVVRAPTDQELRADLSDCAYAPAGYEADWDRLGLPGGRGGTPATSSAAESDPGPTAAGNEEVDAPDAGRMHASRKDSGCALAQTGHQPPNEWLLLALVLVWATIVSRRRRLSAESQLSGPRRPYCAHSRPHTRCRRTSR